jgi:hypothetical protein
MDNFAPGLALGCAVGFLVALVLFGYSNAQLREERDICQRTIQYQLDKTPEEVQDLIKTERVREAR